MNRNHRPRRSHDFKRTVLAVSLLLCFNAPLCSGRPNHRLPVAGIFGIGGNKDAEQQSQRRPVPPQYWQQQSSIPPPPPGRTQGPPPGTSSDKGMQSRAEVGSGTIPGPPRLVRQTAIIPPPPPPPKMVLREEEVEEASVQNFTDAQKVTNSAAEKSDLPEEELQDIPHQQYEYEDNSYQLGPPPTQDWYPPPAANQDVWQQSQGYYDPGFLQNELDQSLARENNFMMQLDNLTAAVAVMEQREELHLRQLDVLTERIIDIETQAAEEHNKLAEYEANCTAYALTVESLNDDTEEWQRRCSELMERQANDTATITELRRAIKEKQSEAEEIAIAIENVRLAEKRREHYQKKGAAARKSMFSRLYSFFFGGQEEFEEMSREDAYDMAKSTLLRALQSERGSVHELEGVVASLQQNNSAISEMVESRDSIIDELNNRISVFEEDKVVLKAALRQLQKEIKEEAPKAQKLMDDLAAAESDSERLRNDINSLIQTHQEELNLLQQQISTKQKTISETESNMTAIGTYVDKLEDRLTSFAVTRRDMEAREKRCKEIEEAAVQTESEKKELEAKLETYSREQEELKKLLEELVNERASLQKDNRKLATDSEFRVAEQEQLQLKCTSLECEVQNLTESLEELRSRSGLLESELEATEQEKATLKEKVEQSITTNDELVNVQSHNAKLREELQATKGENQRLEGDLANVTQKVQELLETKNHESVKKEAVAPPPETARDVPLRNLRKQISKATGIHGVITPSTTMLKQGVQRQKLKLPTFAPIRKSPEKVDSPKPEGMARRPPNRPPPPPFQKKDD
ncbi:unnamed protein product [Cylindrotheca closterium]|uniref:Uncharacterized protein n=1 Tax=Cylindrotheca closterium TaxID=2856 RepID=A0AAD2CS43_9STRA|nr:unnamed protein product [Cylindrotheca closterium]